MSMLSFHSFTLPQTVVGGVLVLCAYRALGWDLEALVQEVHRLAEPP